MPEHNTVTETTVAKTQHSYFLTPKEFKEMVERYLGITIPNDAKYFQIYTARSPANMRAAAAGKKYDKDDNGYTVSFEVNRVEP